MRTYEQARKNLPLCCIGAAEATIADSGETIDALIAAVEHEIEIYLEGQDGCINTKEYHGCVQYMRWLLANY